VHDEELPNEHPRRLPIAGFSQLSGWFRVFRHSVKKINLKLP
jgi:hypothetical protein